MHRIIWENQSKTRAQRDRVQQLDSCLMIWQSWIMKKILIIIFLFLFSNTSYANDSRIDDFNNWLLDNGHTQYLNIEQKAGCKKLIQKHGLKVPKVGLVDEPKVKTNEWFWLECHKVQATNNLKIKFFKSPEIPWGTNPNKDTLLYYLFRYIVTEDGFDRAGSKGSKNPYKFKTELRDDKISKYIKKHMQKTALLSYLLYEDGKISIDEICLLYTSPSPRDQA